MMDQSELSRKLQANRKLAEQKKRSKKAIISLNIAQVLAVLNDNLLKFFTIYFLIDLKGVESSNTIVFLVGVFFVLPFLLFSGYAGLLADRYSKQKIIEWMKAAEIVIVGLGIFVFINKWEMGSYLVVFLLCLQSTLMSPAKYSIIPELVPKDQIAKTNGLITGCSYLAMIVGSFLAALLTQKTQRNFPLAVSVCLLASIIGYLASRKVPKTAARRNDDAATQGMGFKQIIDTLKECRRTPRLLLAVMCTAFFLFIGAFLQLNLIPFAQNSLGMDEVTGGYLFSGTSVGIAIGATLAGRFCRREVHLGLPVFALAIMGVLLMLVPCFASSVSSIALILAGLGLMGGLYQIPLEAYMQTFSASESRGKVVAAANWLSFVGVLLAPITLGVLGSVLALPPSAAFIILGVLVFAILAVMMRYLSIPFLNFVSQNLLHPFYDLHYLGFPFGHEHQEEKIAIVMKKMPLAYVSLILGESTKLHLFIVRKRPCMLDKYLGKLVAIDFLYEDCKESLDPTNMTKKIQGLPSTVKPILLFPSSSTMRYFESRQFFKKLEQDHDYELRMLSLRNTTHFRPALSLMFKRVQLVFALSEFVHKEIKTPELISEYSSQNA